MRYDSGLMMLSIKDESYKETYGSVNQCVKVRTKEGMTQTSGERAQQHIKDVIE